MRISNISTHNFYQFYSEEESSEEESKITLAQETKSPSPSTFIETEGNWTSIFPNKQTVKSFRPSTRTNRFDKGFSEEIASKKNSFLSIKDRSTVPICFSALEKASPSDNCLQLKYRSNLLSPEDLKSMNPDEVLEIVNTFAKQDIFLPINYWPLVLKKYQCKRYGDIETIEKIYNLILEKYSNEMVDTTHREVEKIHAQVMRNYLRRGDTDLIKFSDKIKRIFNRYPSTFTRNDMMEFYLKTKQCDKIEEIWKNNSLQRDYQAYSLYLKSCAVCSKSKKGLIEIINEIPIEYKFHPKIVKFKVQSLLKYELDASLEYLNSIPSEAVTDVIAMLKFGVYFKNNKIEEAKEEVLHSIHEMSMEKSRLIIHKMAKIDPDFALHFYQIKLNTDPEYQKSVFKEDSKIKLNFHLITQTSDGVALYGCMQPGLIQTMLWHLKTTLLRDISARFVTIELITGKGKENILKKSVKKYLMDAFNWKKESIKDFDGRLVVYGNAQVLSQSHLNRDVQLAKKL